MRIFRYGTKSSFVPCFIYLNSSLFPSEYTAPMLRILISALSLKTMTHTANIQSESPAVTFGGAATWKVELAYDGTDFRGWQIQPGLSTIQGALASAIHRITGESVLPQGSGRTDAGVHAMAQVASFALMAAIPPANFLRALNHALPESIRILSACTVAPDFHARHSARGKSYEYRIIVCDPFAGQICPPWLTRFAYAVSRPLDVASMQQAAKCVIGQFDFTSFAASDPDRASRALSATDRDTNNVRIIRESSWTQSHTSEPALSLLVYRVNGNGFLHHMVRNLVGTFLEVGWGERQPADLTRILEARDRSVAGRTAPARGLFLHHVDY